MSPFSRGILVVGVLLLLWLALDLLLLVFLGILLAIFLRALASFTARAFGLSIGWGLALAFIALLSVAGIGGWLYAPRLAEQSDQLTRTLPQAATDLTDWLRQYSWGQWLIDQFSAQASDGDLASRATTAVRRIIDGVVAIVVVIAVGIYLAAQPGPYIRGVLYLVPPDSRVRVAETMFAIAHVLRWWLVGQALAMSIVGLAMGIGLAIIGVQLSFLLGLLAGLFEFVPLVGPVIALGPALLLALAADPQQAAWVLALYLVVQTLEGYLLTPLVQQRTVELPPVVTITAQVALSWAAGPIGLIAAVPLIAVMMVCTQMLYVEDRLGDDVAPEFEDQARREVEDARDGELKELLPARPRSGPG